MIAQVQREGEFVADGRRGFDVHGPRRVADPEETGETPAFRFE